MPEDQLDIIQGTLDMLILRALSQGPKHGWDVLCWIREVSDGVLLPEEGAIYPSLYRMADRGLLESGWGVTENNRRAKFYQLTRRGRAELATRSRDWDRYVAVVTRIMAAPVS
jgi:transcriptional regulator